MRPSEVIAYLPPFHMAKQRADCPTGSKGMVMRQLNKRYGTRSEEQVEGIYIAVNDQEWVHIAPDPELPFFTVVVEGDAPERAQQLAAEYRNIVLEMLPLAV